MKQSLTEIFKRIGHFGNDIGCNDKNGTHTYCETYDKVLAPYRNGCAFMEIGLAVGDSVKLFNEYFKDSLIVACDISIVFDTKSIEWKNNNEIMYLEEDATKQSLIDELPGITFDVIIDDGSHMTQDQIDTFNLLKGKMNKGGIYIIEDILAWEIEEKKYRALHDNIEVIDMRHFNNRFDNMLLIFKF